MEDQIKKIRLELLREWEKQESTGLARLASAYHFFHAVDDVGQMLFSKHCLHVEDMRCGDSGKTDFDRFVIRELDLTDPTKFSCVTDWEYAATNAANKYFSEEAHRLASYIVRVSKLDVTANTEISNL